MPISNKKSDHLTHLHRLRKNVLLNKTIPGEVAQTLALALTHAHDHAATYWPTSTAQEEVSPLEGEELPAPTVHDPWIDALEWEMTGALAFGG